MYPLLLTASVYLILIVVAFVGKFIGSFVTVLSMAGFGRLAEGRLRSSRKDSYRAHEYYWKYM